MNPGRIAATFLDGCRGRIFVLTRQPDRPTGRAVLFVPPFGEEMNKTRPMLAAVARGLAAKGVATVMPDLFGTGDSEGEFREADWGTWKDDLARTVAWAATQGLSVDSMLCVRLGCVLAAEAAADRLLAARRTVFWQPVLDGRNFVTQFLRLRLAATLTTEHKETVGNLRERLAGGVAVEVAGYELAPALAAQIEHARLTDAIGTEVGVLHWLEIVRSTDTPIPGAAAQAIANARTRVALVEADVIAGEPFWSSTEIVRIPELIDRTVAALAAA